MLCRNATFLFLQEILYKDWYQFLMSDVTVFPLKRVNFPENFFHAAR